MDRYDLDIAKINRKVKAGADFNKVVSDHWIGASPLFLFVTPTGHTYDSERSDKLPCGCLTMIRRGHKYAWTDELTKEIRSDERIPDADFDITPEHLPVFAEWQRRLDKEIRQPA